MCSYGVCFNGGHCREGSSQLCDCPAGFSGPSCQYGELERLIWNSASFLVPFSSLSFYWCGQRRLSVLLDQDDPSGLEFLTCHSCVCSVKGGFKLWKDFADVFKPRPRCHLIKNTFLAIWPAKHPRWTLPERSFSPWAAENLLTSAFGFSTSGSAILSAALLLNLSCWSKPVKDSVVFLIKPHDGKFLSVSTHPCLSLKLDPCWGHMKTLRPGFWVGFRLSGSHFFFFFFYSCDIQGLSPHGASGPYGPVGGSIRLRSNRSKRSADSPSAWSELAVVAELPEVASDYFTLQWESHS